jgi:DNA-directed RNA polymerase subunit RPC12/RpoP
VPLDEDCPQCSSKLVMKSGRFGEFTACSNYPKCKYVKQKTIGMRCPNCNEGEIVECRSKRGKTFFGCNRYPECHFVAWGKPIDEKCPQCGSSLGRRRPSCSPGVSHSGLDVFAGSAKPSAPQPSASECKPDHIFDPATRNRRISLPFGRPLGI